MKPAQRILLVGWDAADWRLLDSLIESDDMPHLAKLTTRGAMGNLRSLIPMVCPLLWTSIATGCLPHRHDIFSIMEPDGRGDVRPVQSTSRQREAFWNILSRQGRRTTIVGWPVTYPAEPVHGIILSERFFHLAGPAAARWPADDLAIHAPGLEQEMLRLRVHPAALGPRQLQPFLPPSGVWPDGDKVAPQWLAAVLAPCYSAHRTALWLARHEEWNLLAVHLGILEPLLQWRARPKTASNTGETTPNAEPPHPIIRAGCRLLDDMLGKLVEAVGPETTVFVVSDHGFREPSAAPDLVPRPPQGGPPFDRFLDALLNHHRDAMFCVAGPRICPDKLIHGGTLLDVVPTILALMDLPIARDLDGHPLSEVFVEEPKIESIDTYETPPDVGLRSSSRAPSSDVWRLHEVLEDLAALGWFEPEIEAWAAAEHAVRQRLLHQAESLQVGRRYAEALDAYRTLLARQETLLAHCRVVECLLGLSRLDEAGRELEVIARHAPDWPFLRVLRGRWLARSGAGDRVRELLVAAEKDAHEVEESLEWGHLALGVMDYSRAEAFFRAAVYLDEINPRAQEGLGIALQHLGRVQEAVRHLERSVCLLYASSSAQTHLGMALLSCGEQDRARRALSTALRLDPQNAIARSLLHELGATDRPTRQGA